MSPLPCEGCFLYERTGDACPPARQLYEIDSEQAEQLRRAVIEDAADQRSFAELLIEDAASNDAAPVFAPMPKALPSAPALSNNQKEVTYVPGPHTSA